MIIEGLHRKGLVPSLIITKADQPRGRGLKISPTRISSFAKAGKIPCLKPNSLSDVNFLDKLTGYEPDFFVVADYGKILPAELLKVPKKLPLCVHPSLLPLYRGATPIGRAIINGDKVTGSTVFKMNQAMDAGPIILQEETPIEPGDNFYSLRARLADIGVRLLLRTLKIESWKLQPQKDNLATYAAKLRKEESGINWQNPAVAICNLIRAIIDWPTAVTIYKGRQLKVLGAKPVELKTGHAPGIIIDIKKEGIYVAAKKGALLITRVKPAGRKEMDAYSFACGYRIKIGDGFQ